MCVCVYPSCKKSAVYFNSYIESLYIYINRPQHYCVCMCPQTALCVCAGLDELYLLAFDFAGRVCGSPHVSLQLLERRALAVRVHLPHHVIHHLPDGLLLVGVHRLVHRVNGPRFIQPHVLFSLRTDTVQSQRLQRHTHTLCHTHTLSCAGTTCSELKGSYNFILYIYIY